MVHNLPNVEHLPGDRVRVQARIVYCSNCSANLFETYNTTKQPNIDYTKPGYSLKPKNVRKLGNIRGKAILDDVIGSCSDTVLTEFVGLFSYLIKWTVKI